MVGCFVRSTLVPLATGTRLTWCSEFDLRAVFHKHMPLAVHAAQRLLEVDLLTLRAVLERGENRNDRCVTPERSCALCHRQP